MADDCTCPWTPEHLWTRHYGAVEPGSQRELDPFCPVHGDAMEQTALECGVSAGGTQVSLSKQDVDDMWPDSDSNS